MKYVIRTLALFFLALGLAACAASGSGDTISKAAAFRKTAAHGSFLVNGDYLRIGRCYYIKKAKEFRVPGSSIFVTGISRGNGFVYTMNNATIMGTSLLMIVDFKPAEKQGHTNVTVHSIKGILSGLVEAPAITVQKELADCIGT